MSAILVYLGQVSIGTILLYGCFFVFYRKETFYRRNRILLMLSMLLPLFAPLINLSGLLGNPANGSVGNTIYRIVALGDNPSPTQTGVVGTLDYPTLLFWIWFSVASFLLLSAFLAVIRTISIIHKGRPVNISKHKTVVSDLNYPPFSFWSVIVLPRSIYENGGYSAIIGHESTHLEQRHTIDLLICEVYKAFFWFNPVSWLIKKSVILNHEYLADNAIAHKSVDIKQYQYSLLNIQPSLLNISIVHNFSNNIKNRIVMMNKKPTSGRAAWKNLLVIPMVMFLLLAFSFKSAPISGQQPVISQESRTEIFKFMMNNVLYPQEAREAGVTGKIFIIVEFGANGKIKKVVAEDGNVTIDVPLILDELFVVGYGPSATTAATGTKDLKVLKNEGKRIGQTLETLDLPEFKNGNIKFAIPVVFKLEVR